MVAPPRAATGWTAPLNARSATPDSTLILVREPTPNRYMGLGSL